MKNTINILLFIILIVSFSCNKEKSKYSIYWQDNNLCVVMPHPTMGIISPGLIDWRGVELNEVNDHILYEIHKTNLSGNALVWVRFEKPEHDKYGNESMSYDDHLVAIIPISEGKKYKSGNYLDMEYHLTNLFVQSAFPKVVSPPYVTSKIPIYTYPNTISETSNYYETYPTILEQILNLSQSADTVPAVTVPQSVITDQNDDFEQWLRARQIE